MVWRLQDDQEDAVSVGRSNERPVRWRSHSRNIYGSNQVIHGEGERGIYQGSHGGRRIIYLLNRGREELDYPEAERQGSYHMNHKVVLIGAVKSLSMVRSVQYFQDLDLSPGSSTYGHTRLTSEISIIRPSSPLRSLRM